MNYTRSQINETMSMGKRSIISISKKQKKITGGSTEEELIAMNEMLLNVLWTR
jgi:hypothetical protein